MSDIENQCLCNQVGASLCGGAEKLPETIKALTELVNAICNCGCNGKPTDPTDPTDPTTPEGGEEYRVDKDMTSNAGVDGMIPLASSTLSGYEAWRPFKEAAPSANHADYDAWCSNYGATNFPSDSKPQWLQLTLGGSHLVSRVDVVRRLPFSELGYFPSKVKLRGMLAGTTEWVDLTDIIQLEDKTSTIQVPLERQKLVSTVRLEIYLGQKTGEYVLISRMPIYAKKVS